MRLVWLSRTFDCILVAGLVARGRNGFDHIKDQAAGEGLVGRIRAQSEAC